MLDNGSSVEYDLICPMVAQTVKRLPAMREIQVQSLGREDLLVRLSGHFLVVLPLSS